MTVYRTIAELHAVDELRLQQYGDQHLAQAGQVAAELDSGARQSQVVRQLLWRGFAAQHAVELFAYRRPYLLFAHVGFEAENLGERRVGFGDRAGQPAVLFVLELDGLTTEPPCHRDLSIGDPARVAQHDQEVAPVASVEVVVAHA